MRENSAIFSPDHYVQRLDLGANPFEKGYRTDYFFGGGQRRQMLDQVLHFSRYSNQVVMLVGSTGSGTSTILQNLLDRLAPIMDFCTVDAETFSSPEQLLSLISKQLQFERCDSVTGFLAALNMRDDAESSGDPLLLTVDQAHFLSIESFETLRQLYQQAGGGLHLLLVGEYQVEQLARLSGFDPGQLKVLELEPLNMSETGDYVLGALQAVGYAGEQPLSVDQLAVLHEQSGGNITEINLLVPTLLSVRNKINSPGVNFSIPVPHVAAIAILVVAIAVSFWFGNDEDPVGHSDQLAAAELSLPATTGLEQRAEPLSNKEMEVAREPAVDRVQKDLAIAPLSGVEEETGGRVERATGSTTEPNRLVKSEPPTAAATSADASADAALAGDVAATAEEASAAPASNEPDSQAIVQPATLPPVVAENAGAEQAPPSASVDAEPDAGMHTNQTSSAVSQPSAPKQDTNPLVESVPRSLAQSEAPPDLLPRQQHILAMEESGFLLQLMGASDESRAIGLVKAYVGQLPITYFEARRKGAPWFVVITGPYTTKQAARDGIAGLPESLQQQKPWVRSVAGVQQEIRSTLP